MLEYSKADVIPNSPSDFYVLCVQRKQTAISNEPGKLGTELNILLSLVRDNTIDLNITTAATFKIDFGSSLNDNNESDPSISVIFSVRGFRLDLYSNISKDVVYYYQRDNMEKCSNDQCVGYLMFQKMQSSAMQFVRLDRPIIQATTYRSRFLLLTLNNSRFDSNNPVVHYLLEYRNRQKNSSLTLLEELKSSICSSQNEIIGCMTKITSPKFIQQYYVEEEDQYLFEFVNPDSPLNLNEDLNASKPTVDIDVYRYEKTNQGFVKVIHKWRELITINAFRFTCAEFFIQVHIQKGDKNVKNISNEYSIYIYLSQRRYQSKPRLAFRTMKTMLSNVHTVFFDDIRRRIFILSAHESYFVEINQATMELNYSINLPTTIKSLVEKPTTPIPKPENWVSSYCQFFTRFRLTISQNQVMHYFCFNPKIKPGNFFFQTSSLSRPDNESNSQVVILPEGLVNEIDYDDILKGSFIKIIPNDKKMLGDIISTFLDPYSYSLPKIKQIRFLQNIYGIETQEGEDHKVFFAISTRYENVLFGGKKLHSLQEDKLIYRKNLTDFRSMDDLHPVNLTHAIAQVDEMTYSINLRLILNDKPALKSSSSSQKQAEPFTEIETPSKGINGVCKNSTNLRHSTLGKIKVCLADHEAFIKPIDRDEEIRKVILGGHETDLFKTEIGTIKFIKSSDFYPNYLFIFYKKKIDLLKPTLSDKTKEDEKYLRMMVFKVEGHANPRLIYLQLHKFDIPEEFLGLEVAGNRVVTLFIFQDKQPNSAGSTKLKVYSVNPDLNLKSVFEVKIPERFALPSQPQLYLTDLISEVDEDNNLNTVINSQSKMYQISFKVLSQLTKETKVIVFNPHLQPIDSMSLIELPPGFQILEIGPHYKITPNSHYKTLAILGAKTTKLDEDFYSREIDLHMFLVQDMTPSLVMKPYKRSNQILGSTAQRNNKSVDFSFNLTSSIHPESFLKENRLKENNAKDKEVFEDVIKHYTILYANWSSEFTAKEANMSNKTINRTIQIETQLFKDIFQKDSLIKLLPDSIKNKNLTFSNWNTLRAKDLKRFFIRLDPRDFVSGNVYEWRGEAESTVENYMGIVKVLDMSKEAVVDTEYTNERIENKALHSFDLKLNWRCSEAQDCLLGFTNKSNEASYWRVNRSCNYSEPQRTNFTFSFGRKIYQITPVNILEPLMIDNNTHTVENETLNLKQLRYPNFTNASYVLNGNFIFFLGAVNRSSYLCVLDWSKNISGYRYEDDCHMLKVMYTNIRDLSLEVIFLNKQMQTLTYLARIADYSNSLKLYSKVNLYLIRFKESTRADFEANSTLNLAVQIIGSLENSSTTSNTTNNTNTSKTSKSDQFFSTDNIKFNYYHFNQSSSAPLDSWRISVFVSNYRWKNNTNLFIYISHLSFTVNFTQNSTEDNIELNRTDHCFSVFNLSSDYNSLRNMLRKVEIIPKQQFGLLGADEDLSLILNIKMGHSYLIKIQKSGFKSENSLNLSYIGYNEVSIAVFQNPFIGFQPETQTPSPFFIDDYFFRVINLQSDAYLLNYKINHSKYLEPKLFDGNKEIKMINNIFCVNYSSDSLNSSKLLDSCFTNMSAYITTSNIVKLRHKPVVFIVVPNFNTTNYLEHRMVSISDNEQLITTNFTSFINIRVQTHQLASNYIDLNITGPFKTTQAIRLNLKSGTGIAFEAKYVIYLIIISTVSILIAIVMSCLISRNTDGMLTENKKILMRSSLKPFSSAMLDLFRGSTKKKTTQEDKEKEEQLLQSQSSDESDEPEKKIHQHLRHPREPEEEHEPKHRDNDRSHDRPRTTPDGQK